MSKVYAVYERARFMNTGDEDGYYVLSICTTEEEAEKHIERYFNSRLKITQNHLSYDPAKTKVETRPAYKCIEAYDREEKTYDTYEYYYRIFPLDAINPIGVLDEDEE